MNTRPASLRAVFQRFIPTVVLFLFVCSASGAEQPRRTFDVPAGDAAATLRQFASQAAQQVAFPAEVVRGIKTNRVKGEYTAREALDQMTAGTKLVAVEDAASGALSVRRERSLAEAEKNGASRPVSDRTASGEKVEGVLKLDTFEVMGSKLLNMDKPRTRDDVQPYVVFNRSEMEQSGASNLEDFFRSRLSMNTVQGTTNQNPLSAQGNQSAVNLRGLGTNQTLILVDGRRLPNAYGSGTVGFFQPDINGIPMSAVERVEILPSTASGIHGGGATGGVINIILRRNYLGAELTATYGNTFSTDVASRRIDFSAGFSLGQGRTDVLLMASYADANDLLTQDRDLVTRSRALIQTNNPVAFSTLTTPPRGATANIRNQSGANLQLKPAFGGATLPSAFTSLPVGYAGATSDNGAALVANAGRYNLELPATAEDALRPIVSAPKAKSFAVSARHKLMAQVEVFGDFSWLDNQSSGHNGGVQPASTILQATAPNNPFTTPIVVVFPLTPEAFAFQTRSTTTRAIAGTVIQLPHDWKSAIDYVWSRSRRSWYSSSAFGDPDGVAGPGIPIGTALGNGTIDVMRDLNAFPPNLVPYQFSTPNSFFGPAETRMQDISLRLSGPTVTLPGGPLILSALAERRTEMAEELFQDSTNTTSAANLTTFWPERKQTVDSYYVETTAKPFPSTHRWLASVELQGAIRHDRYETETPTPSSVSLASRMSALPVVTLNSSEVRATKYTVGFRWSPISDVALRASAGTGFLPPAIQQLSAPQAVTRSMTLVDPKRGGVSASVGPFTNYIGGNPSLVPGTSNAQLKPEESKAESAGIIITPRVLPGLRLSVDYTHLRKTNEILTPAPTSSMQLLLDQEAAFPGRVTRAPLLPADAALGYTGGVITAIDDSLTNLAVTELEAWDVRADYDWGSTRLGRWNIYAAATWQPHFKRQTSAGTAMIDSAGFSSGVLVWRGNCGATWEHGRWSAAWNMQYYDSYKAYAADSTAGVIMTATLNQGSDTIPRQVYHDLFVRYRFAGRGFLSGIELSASVQNVLNRRPPILASTGSTGGYSLYGDPRLRRYTLGVRKVF